MIAIEDGNKLAKVDSGTIAKQDAPLTVGQLELALLARFPRVDAEPWDRTGLLVGDPAELVTGVAVALDPTAVAIEAAEAAGANVVLTHHPAFLDPPTALSPSHDVATTPGVNVWTAVRKGIALMNFHTALDVSPEASRLLPGMLSLAFERMLVPAGSHPGQGYGALCRVRGADEPFTLERLAARCVSVFGRVPRVWGQAPAVLKSIAVANGAAGNVLDACVDAGADCLVCGEVRYHSALDAVQAGLSIVELGHDASELPLTAILAKEAVGAGVDAASVFVVDQSSNWTTPDSTRM